MYLRPEAGSFHSSFCGFYESTFSQEIFLRRCFGVLTIRVHGPRISLALQRRDLGENIRSYVFHWESAEHRGQALYRGRRGRRRNKPYRAPTRHSTVQSGQSAVGQTLERRRSNQEALFPSNQDRDETKEKKILRLKKEPHEGSRDC